MRLEFTSLPTEEQREYFIECGNRSGLAPVIVEKDFWVCWMLGLLFRSSFADHVVFKGGTSLSKVFGAIDRFSEDIDLSLSPEFLKLPEPGSSRNQANKWMARAETACIEMVRDHLMPELNQQVLGVLRLAKDIDQTAERIEFQVDSQSNSPVLLFHYPTTQPAGFDYLRRSVKLEFGSLTEQRPTGRHKVTPWLADEFPQLFNDWNCEVVALEIERTFWEKATILHTERFEANYDGGTTNQPTRESVDTEIRFHYEGLPAIMKPP